MHEKSSLKNKKLTDFFSQKSSASVPASVSPSSPTGMMVSMTRKRSAVQASETISGRKSPMSSSAPQVRSAPTEIPRKRAYSPDSTHRNTPALPLYKSESPIKPTNTFQSGSDTKRRKAVVYITSPLSSCNSLAQRPTPVRVHDATLVASPLDSSEQIVYSSQSDEAELILPVASEPRDLGRIVQSIHAWRRKASGSLTPSSLRVHEEAMEVDSLSSSPIRSSRSPSVWSESPHVDAIVRSPELAGNTPALQTPNVTSVRFPSPADTTELPPLPPTPKPIDPEAKTAKLIAEIKARAFAASHSSDDEQPLLFRELEDSDDDDLDDDLPLVDNAKKRSYQFPASRIGSGVFSSPLSSVPSVSNDTTAFHTRMSPDRGSPPLQAKRVSARTRKPAPAFRLPLTIAESSTFVGVSRSASLPSNRKKSQVVNPLDALLREKELQTKRGTSSAALRLAEEAAKQGSHDASLASGDESDGINVSRLADERAAWKAVHESRKSTSPVDSSGVADFTIGDRESEMLGAVAGKAIKKILVSDRDDKGKEKAQTLEKTIIPGIPLWTQSSAEDMEVDAMSISYLSGHPILTCLDGFFRNDNDSFLDLTLHSGALAAVPRDVILSNVPQLMNMVLFASSQVASAVSIAFRELWGSDPPKVHMPFNGILLALVELGASPSVLEGYGLIVECTGGNRVTQEVRLEALKRLLAMMKTAGFAGAFSSDDVANVVLILAIMGLDPLTSSELHTQLSITMDVVCNRGATDCLLHAIHGKVYGFAGRLVPANKAQLVALFASGSGRTRSIARRLAYCLLVPTSVSLNDQAPSLEPLILLLSPDAGSCEMFDVTNESMDYEEVVHHVNILSVALVDIAPYVEQERAILKSTSSILVPRSPTKSKKQTDPPLELLRKVLEVLRNKIDDTRAAHLDRSRAKAAIHRLTMRIYCDRMALIGAPRQRAPTLKAYFSPQRQ